MSSRLCTCSGDMYDGLPAMPSMREISESATSAIPKSMMRTSLSVVSMRLVNFKRLMPAFVMLATPIVLADAREEGAQEAIDAMVVTATRSNALVRDQPIRVEVVPKEEVEENLTIQPGNLSTLLNELAGVHVQTVAPSLGGARLQLRGLPGRHTVVLQDRLPLLGAETDAFGLLQTPPLDLERVELIKGAASALYGGSALGGVLNLVSRPPGSEPEVLVNRTSRGGTDLVGFVPASLPSEWGFTLTGGAHDQTTEDIDHDGWADLPAYRRYTLRPRVFYRDGDERSLLGTVGFVDEDRDGGTLDGRSLADGTVFPESLHTRRLDGGAVGDFKLNDGRHLSAQGSVTRTEHDRVFGATRAHERAALRARKHQRTQALLDLGIGARQDHAATRASQRLMGGRGGDVSNRHRVRIQVHGTEPGNVCHVDQQVSANVVGDLAKARKIDDPRVRGKPGDDQLGTMFLRKPLHLRVIDQSCCGIQAVLNRLEVAAGEIDLCTVREMTALIEAHG